VNEEQEALKARIEDKKKRQAAAWQRWWKGHAGAAWRLKRKLEAVQKEKEEQS